METVDHLDYRMIQIVQIVEDYFKGVSQIRAEGFQGGFIGFNNQFIRSGQKVFCFSHTGSVHLFPVKKKTVGKAETTRDEAADGSGAALKSTIPAGN
jgi:hypothetical protein